MVLGTGTQVLYVNLFELSLFKEKYEIDLLHNTQSSDRAKYTMSASRLECGLNLRFEL